MIKDLKRVGWTALSLLATGIVSAQSPPTPPVPPVPSAPGMMLMESWEMSPRMLERMADELQLTPAQQGKITEIMANHRPKMRQLREQWAEESRQLREMGPQDADFDARSQAAAARIGALSSSMVEQNAVLRREVWGVLTPDQRVTLQQRQGEMRERMQERRQRMPERRERLRERRDGRQGDRRPPVR